MSKLNSQADKAEMGQGIADLTESYRITKLEAIVSDLYESLRVMNEQITHNSAGIEPVAGSSGDDNDAGNYTDELEQRLKMISELDFDDDNDACAMYYAIMGIGANLIGWDLDFEDTKYRVLNAILKVDTDKENLSFWVDRALLTGAAGHNQDS